MIFYRKRFQPSMKIWFIKISDVCISCVCIFVCTDINTLLLVALKVHCCYDWICLGTKKFFFLLLYFKFFTRGNKSQIMKVFSLPFVKMLLSGASDNSELLSNEKFIDFNRCLCTELIVVKFEKTKR